MQSSLLPCCYPLNSVFHVAVNLWDGLIERYLVLYEYVLLLKVGMLKLCCYNNTLCIFLALLLAYMKGNGNLCRTLVKAGACLGAMNKDGVTIFNYQVATKQLLSRYNNLYTQIWSIYVLRPFCMVLSSMYGLWTHQFCEMFSLYVLKCGVLIFKHK